MPTSHSSVCNAVSILLNMLSQFIYLTFRSVREGEHLPDFLRYAHMIFVYVKDKIYQVQPDNPKRVVKRPKFARTTSPPEKCIISSSPEPLNLAEELDEDLTIYTEFKKAVYSRGQLHWRFHSRHKDIIVLSDFNSHTKEMRVGIHKLLHNTTSFTGNPNSY